MRALHVLQNRAAAIRARVRDSVGAAIASGAAAAALRAHREIDLEAESALRRDPRSPACSAGCSYCCHVHVEATEAEVLAIVDHLVEIRSPSEIDAMVAKLEPQVALVNAMDHQARWDARIPCALLAPEGTCTIHSVRPLRCRAFHSCAVEACRDAFAGDEASLPEENLELTRACDAAEEGYDAALEDGGLSTEPLLLESALLRALVSRLFRA